MDSKFKLENQLCFRLYTASRLITQAYHPLLGEYGLTYPQYMGLLVLWLETNTVTPLLKRMEAEGILTRTQGEEDARQMIVKLTAKGRGLKKKLAEVPDTVGQSVLCASITPETSPGLFVMLDDIIEKLKK